MDLAVYRKAIVAIIAPIVIGLALKLFTSLGLDFTTDVSNAVTVILTGLMVYLIPNKES